MRSCIAQPGRIRVKAAPYLVALAVLATGPALADDPVPHHEHVALYENCVKNLMQKMREEQAIIAKSICMCQSTQFAKNHAYAELTEIAKTPGKLETTARAYMDACVPQVKDQLKLR